MNIYVKVMIFCRNITNLVVIGGDGSLTGANCFRNEWPGSLKGKNRFWGKQFGLQGPYTAVRPDLAKFRHFGKILSMFVE